MIQLHDIRESKVWREAYALGFAEGNKEGDKIWQDAYALGLEEGIKEGETRVRRRLIRKWLSEGRSLERIAELLEISVKEVRRLAKDKAT